MARGKKTKKRTYWQIVIVVAVVFVGSLFALFSTAPDQIFARSQDGLVTLKAVTHSSDTVEISRYLQTQDSVKELVSPIYQISTNVDTLVEDGELEILLDEGWGEDLDVTEAVIYYFDRPTLTWKALETSFRLSDQSLQAPVEFTGSLLVGVGSRVQDE